MDEVKQWFADLAKGLAFIVAYFTLLKLVFRAVRALAEAVYP